LGLGWVYKSKPNPQYPEPKNFYTQTQNQYPKPKKCYTQTQNPCPKPKNFYTQTQNPKIFWVKRLILRHIDRPMLEKKFFGNFLENFFSENNFFLKMVDLYTFLVDLCTWLD